MNESRENNLRTFPSDSSLTEHINSMPSPRQSKVMKPKATLETINENDNDENVLNASDCGKTPFPHKLKNENNLASVDNHPNRRSTRLRKEPGVEFQYIESKHCDNEESNFSSENSTINENDHENVQTRIENYNLSPRIRLGNELFSQNHAQANNNRPNQHTGNRERINDHNQPSNANPQQNVDAYRALSQRVSQEVHVLLRTHLEFYCFTIATYIILFLINREITTLFAEIVAVWVYILVQIIETLEIQVRQENHSVNQKRKLFVLFDWICVLIFTVGLALKAGVTSEDRVSIIFTPFCAPGLLNILVYSFTKTPQSGILKKRISVLKRIILWAQLVLVALKVDGYLDADWMITFVIAKIGLGILIFYSLFPLFIFINVVITTLRGIRVMGRLPIKVQLVGFGWSFITSLFSTFWMIVLFGIDDLLEENSYSELLNSGLIASFVHVGILMLTTLLLRPYLKVFLRYLFLQSISNRTRAREARIEYNVRFEVIDPEPIYLLPISSTFHQMLHEEMSSYTKEELQQWKNQIHKTRKLKYLRTETKTNSGSPKKNQIDGQKTCTKLNHSADFATHHGQEDESLVFGHRPNFTSDDLEIYENIKRPTKQEAREAENMCYVCVQRPPTAIIMDCGHSGICYECAIEGWRKDEKCMMCRQRVNNILKVKFYEKLNISKSIHGTKKIVDVPAEN